MLICCGGGGGGGGGGGVDFAVGSQVETPLVVFLVETLLDLAVTLFETPVVVVVVTLLEGLKLRPHCLVVVLLLSQPAGAFL